MRTRWHTRIRVRQRVFLSKMINKIDNDLQSMSKQALKAQIASQFYFPSS